MAFTSSAYWLRNSDHQSDLFLELQTYIVNSLLDTSHVSDLIHIKQRLDSSHPNPFFTNFPILVSHTIITQLLKPKSHLILPFLSPLTYTQWQISLLLSSEYSLSTSFLYLYCCHHSLSSHHLSSGSHQIHPNWFFSAPTFTPLKD